MADAPTAAQEIIIALPSDVEGDATSHYLAKVLAATGARVTRIAQGLPAGGGTYTYTVQNIDAGTYSWSATLDAGGAPCPNES